MAIQTDIIPCEIEQGRYEGLLQVDDGNDHPVPGILVCHAWRGRSAFEDGKAHLLALQGYAALSIDLYGVGKRGTDKASCSALMAPFIEDRAMLQARLAHWHTLLKTHPRVDASRTAIMGFCFGGLCALDLARSGAVLDAAVSVHGLLGAPAQGADAPPAINASVLALHGWDDPMAPPADVQAFAAEMSRAGADWQLHAYGNTMHAFTNPDADDPEFGTVYAPLADRRSWESLTRFLAEVFGDDA